MKYLSDEYKAYIASQDWFRRRALKLVYAGGARGYVNCEMCSREFPCSRVHVHHLSYERLGCERLSDLQVVCPTCHAIVGAYPHIHEASDVGNLEPEVLAILARIDSRIVVEFVQEQAPAVPPEIAEFIEQHGREPTEREWLSRIQQIIERKRKLA